MKLRILIILFLLALLAQTATTQIGNIPSSDAVEVAFAQLPAARRVGTTANISDSNTAVWGANVAAGGANHILARWNGSNWTVVGK